MESWEMSRAGWNGIGWRGRDEMSRHLIMGMTWGKTERRGKKELMGGPRSAFSRETDIPLASAIISDLLGT
jgi:hypothetical protein